MATADRGEVCVLCRRRPVDPARRPFCSERCQLLDLARWADGSYRIPGPAAAEAEEGPDREPEDPDR